MIDFLLGVMVGLALVGTALSLISLIIFKRLHDLIKDLENGE